MHGGRIPGEDDMYHDLPMSQKKVTLEMSSCSWYFAIRTRNHCIQIITYDAPGWPACHSSTVHKYALDRLDLEPSSYNFSVPATKADTASLIGSNKVLRSAVCLLWTLRNSRNNLVPRGRHPRHANARCKTVLFDVCVMSWLR
jgi:hypothetical protein